MPDHEFKIDARRQSPFSWLTTSVEFRMLFSFAPCDGGSPRTMGGSKGGQETKTKTEIQAFVCVTARVASFPRLNEPGVLSRRLRGDAH